MDLAACLNDEVSLGQWLQRRVVVDDLAKRDAFVVAEQPPPAALHLVGASLRAQDLPGELLLQRARGDVLKVL